MFQTSGFKVFLLYPLYIEKMLQEIWGIFFFFRMFLFGFLLLCTGGMSAALWTSQESVPEVHLHIISASNPYREPCRSINTVEINNLLGVNSPCCLFLSITLRARGKWGILQNTWDTSMWLSWPFSLIIFPLFFLKRCSEEITCFFLPVFYEKMTYLEFPQASKWEQQYKG